MVGGGSVNEDQFAIAEWQGSIPEKTNTAPVTGWTAVPEADPNGWVGDVGIAPSAGWYWLSASYRATAAAPSRTIMYVVGPGETRTNDVAGASNIAGTASKLVYTDGTVPFRGVHIWHDGATALDFKLTVRMARIGGGGGGGGPHDHDYLPLAGGNVTGDLGVDGKLNVGADFVVNGINVEAGYLRVADGDYSWPSYSFTSDMQAGFYLVEPQKIGVRQNLMVRGDLQVDGSLYFSGVAERLNDLQERWR